MPVLDAYRKTRRAGTTECCISVNTVKFHLKNVFKKLGVASRREAVNEAVARGLVKK